jgi:hypothetical protein
MENMRKEEAHRLLDEAKTAIDEELASPLTHWSRRNTLELLRDEADSLIKPKEVEKAVENKSPDNERSSNSVEQALEETRK